jgi:uncharacterized protein (DUF58 family)
MRPTLRAVLLCVAGLALAILPTVVSPSLWILWLAWLGVTLLAIGADAALSIPPKALGVSFDAPDSLMIGQSGRLTVTVAAPAGAASTDAEAIFELGPLVQEVDRQRVPLRGGESSVVQAPLRPLRRGTAALENLWLRWTGPMGLVSRQRRVPVDREVAVVPNVAAVRGVAIRYFTPHEYASGLKVERYVGDGSEFESLREYVPGLDSRSISWRATARHRRLICQEFRAERNHQIVLAVDTGHLMREPIGGVPKLDHAVTAGLVLAYMGLHTGDRVGFYGFDAKPRAYAEPQGGVHAFPRLRRLSADLEYSHDETNFTLGLAELSRRLRRRSLVVLLTDFVDTVTAELMFENVDRLARRHLVIFVTLRDPSLEQVAHHAPRTLTSVYEAVVASELVKERDLVIARLRQKGVVCVDTAPERVNTALINQYLEIKRRELV